MAYVNDRGAIEDRGGRSARAAVPASGEPRFLQFSSAARRARSACPEIDCLRHRLAPAVLAAAENRARALNVGANEVLIASGVVSEEAYCHRLAFSLGLRFIEVDQCPRSACPVGDDTLLLAGRTDVVALRGERGLVWAVAPQGLTARALVAFVGAHPELRHRLAVTTPARLRRFVQLHCGGLIGQRAAEALRAGNPVLSAAPRERRIGGKALLALAVFALAMTAAPLATLALLQAALTAIFLASTGLRLFGAMRSVAEPPALRVPSDAFLPRYTVVAALYDEVEALPGLIEALKALDYPAEKLDVKLVLEADDAWTQLAAEVLKLPSSFEILIAPATGPRTKPKALNCALPFARGDLVVVYDAEDRPDPDQLRRAAAAFAADRGGKLACVQARLTIDNTDDSWLTRLFTAEYAGLFDVLLPGLASLRLPIPLGGSSNHFRASVLRAVGGWDPYNVTEDADLGARLARFGYRSTVIDSTTYEEAPTSLRPWLRQRTRWFKGWMQTLIVHMREPRRLWRELGPGGFAAFHLIVGGAVVAALIQPIALVWIAGAWLAGAPIVPAEAAPHLLALGWMHLVALAGGYAVSAVLGLVGLKRRRLLSAAGALAAVPILWVLLSVAAWRAVFQLLRQPQLWEKTAHGRARTSRRGRAQQGGHK